MTQEVPLTHTVAEGGPAPMVPTSKQQSTIKKILYSVMIVLVLSIGFFRVVDDVTHESVDASLKSATLSFATARALDAGITVAQSTEVNFFVGTVTIGELLNPISDLVDKFAWVMLLAMTSLGIQKFILVLMSSGFINVILMLSGVVWFITLWFRSCSKFSGSALKYFKLVVFIRFAVVITLILNIFVDRVFIKDEVASANENVSSLVELVDPDKMQTLSKQLAEQEQLPEEESSVIDSMKAKWQNVKDSTLNPAQKIADVNEKVESSVANFVHLMTLFLLKTLFIPLFFLWLMKSLFTRYCN